MDRSCGINDQLIGQGDPPNLADTQMNLFSFVRTSLRYHFGTTSVIIKEYLRSITQPVQFFSSFDCGVQHFANLRMIFINIFYFGYLASNSLHLYLVTLMQASHHNHQNFLKWPSAAFQFCQHSLSSLSDKVNRSKTCNMQCLVSQFV